MQFKYSASWCSCLSWRSMLEHKGGEGGNGFSSSKVNAWSMRECRDLSYNPWQELLVQRGSVAKHGQKPWAFGNPINGETINNLLRKLKRLSQNMHFYRSPTNFHREVSRRSVPKFPKFHFRSSFSLTQHGHLVRCERVDSSSPSLETLLQEIQNSILTITFTWFWFKSKFRVQGHFLWRVGQWTTWLVFSALASILLFSILLVRLHLQACIFKMLTVYTHNS